MIVIITCFYVQYKKECSNHDSGHYPEIYKQDLQLGNKNLSSYFETILLTEQELLFGGTALKRGLRSRALSPRLRGDEDSINM